MKKRSSQNEVSLTMRMDKISPPEDNEENGTKLYNYLEEINGQCEVLNSIEMDHSYSRPSNWRPDNYYAKPAKKLFIPKANKPICLSEEIDPCGEDSSPEPLYDKTKALQLLNETKRLITLLRSEPGDPDWESKIIRTNWSYAQGRLFDRIVRILNLEYMNRLTYANNWNEPILRRVSLDKSTRRFRTAMGSVAWRPKFIHWLHNLFLEVLDTPYLVIYIDILQTLKEKVPALVDRLISAPSSASVNTDALNVLLNKSWDPTASALTCYKPKAIAAPLPVDERYPEKRLPGDPLIVVVPFSVGGYEHSSRVERWLPYLSQIGTVVQINTSSVTSKVTVVTNLEHMLSVTRAKLADLRTEYAGRPIILFGLNSGSALACQVALVEPASAVVCLGFPLNTVEEKRGQPDDSILNLSIPVLFVIGQHAATSYVDDIEDLRERLRVETGLVIVGAADDHLRINKSKQKSEGITQKLLDRCIIDEVADFVGTLLSTPVEKKDDTRPRFRVIEKKRKISVQDEFYHKRQNVPTPPSQDNNSGVTLNVTSYRRSFTARGRGRGNKYVNQLHRPLDVKARTSYKKGTNGVMPYSRRGGKMEKSITRPSIENISVINSTNLDLLGSEEFSLSSGENSFVGELTPDTLLEMPVIIAHDNQDVSQDSIIKVDPSELRLVDVEQEEERGVTAAGAANTETKCATIYVRKKPVTARGGRSSLNISRQTHSARGSLYRYNSQKLSISKNK